MARNCRFPKVGTHGCQPGYHDKELPVPRGWNSCFPTWKPEVTIAKNFQLIKFGTDGSPRGNQRLPWQGTAGCRPWNLLFPTWKPEATIASTCRFPEVRIMCSKLSGYYCKELLVPKAWNSWFQTWKKINYRWKDLLIPKDKNSWFLKLFCFVSRAGNKTFFSA